MIFQLCVAAALAVSLSLGGCGRTDRKGFAGDGETLEGGGNSGGDTTSSGDGTSAIKKGLDLSLANNSALREDAVDTLDKWTSFTDALEKLDLSNVEALTKKLAEAEAAAKKLAEALDRENLTALADAFRRLYLTRTLVLLQGPQGEYLYVRDLADAAASLQRGFKSRGPAFRVYKTAQGIGKAGEVTLPLYRCPIAKPRTAYFVTTKKNCEGKSNNAIMLGHILKASSTAPFSLFRLSQPSRPNYRFAVDSGARPAKIPAGWKNEGRLGALPY